MIFNINRRDYPCIWKAYRNIKVAKKTKKANLKMSHVSDMKKQLLFSLIIRIDMTFFKKYLNNLLDFLEVETCFYCWEISVFCIIARVFTWCNIKTVIQTHKKQETHIPESMQYCVTGTVKVAEWISAFTQFTSITPKSSAFSSKLYFPVWRNYKTM